MSAVTKKRLVLAVIFVLLTAAEFYIGLFVDDAFIRPYFGDVLIVIVLYAFIRIIFPEKFKYLWLAVFCFAVLVEISQIFPLVNVLGIKNRFVRTLMGSSFAWGDIIAYAAGCVPLAVCDMLCFKKQK